MMDWNKRWDDVEVKGEINESRNTNDFKGSGNQKKWNYIFLESLKMAFILPLVILFTEIFILDIWPDIQGIPIELIYDYLFLFSMIFLIFVVYHLMYWNRL